VRKGARLLAGSAAALALLAPANSAVADDDPGPAKWPTVELPTDGGSGGSDPVPVRWAQPAQPDAGTDGDPTPPKWPGPEQG
jgi:hypothetical protein